MDDAWGGEAVVPAPTRDVLAEAFARLDGGPVPVGRLAYAVCEVLGVDTQSAGGSYGLRKLFAYQQFVTLLKRMVAEGEVEARTKREWTRISGGLLTWGGNQRDLTYALAAHAKQVRAALAQDRAGRELALHVARQRVLREHAADVDRYAAEWLAERSEGGSGDDGDGAGSSGAGGHVPAGPLRAGGREAVGDHRVPGQRADGDRVPGGGR